MIIGISGKRGTGKSVSADHLVKKHKFIKLSFADDLRALAKQMFPFTDLDFNSPGRKEKPWKTYEWSPRDFLLHLGEFGRYHDKDYWLKRALAKCKDSPHINYVIDDVRFINEADTIRFHSGKIIRIERYEKHNPYGKNLDIPSETEMDDYKFDFTVERVWNLAMENLYKQLDIAMEDLK